MLGTNGSWTREDAEVLASLDRKADRDAALLRLGAASLVTLALIVIVAVGSLWTSWLSFVAAANLIQALWALRLVSGKRHRGWTPWVLATADACLLFAIARFGSSFGDLLPGARAALVSLWGSFLLLALMAFRQRADVIVYLTALLALNFVLIILSPPEANLTASGGVVDFERLFSPGANAVRFMMIVLTGAVLAMGAHRSRTSLKTAIRIARERSALRRFVPQELDAYLTSSDLATLQTGRRLEVGVLFADLRNFTALSEDLDAFRVAELLRNFRIRAERAVARHGGVIDKFIGDGLLAVFGITDGSDPANVLPASLALVAEVEEWNAKRKADDRRSVRIGIGAHIGECFVGALGGDSRMEFTVVGDAVNVAQRLEEVSRDYPPIVASEVAVARLKPVSRRNGWQEIPNLTLRGRQMAIKAHALRSDCAAS